MIQYKGLGGWLLFFCLSLTIFSPMVTLYNLVSSYGEVSPHFDRVPGLYSLFIIDSLLSAGLMVLSINAGVGLWKIRPRAVATAKTFLKLYLAYGVFIIFLPFLVGLPSQAAAFIVGASFIGAVRVAIFFGIWNAYLNKSKRVKATFGSVQ